MKFKIDTELKTITIYDSFTLKELEEHFNNIMKDNIYDYKIIIEPIFIDRIIVKDNINPFNTPYSPNPYYPIITYCNTSSNECINDLTIKVKYT